MSKKKKEIIKIKKCVFCGKLYSEKYTLFEIKNIIKTKQNYKDYMYEPYCCNICYCKN